MTKNSYQTKYNERKTGSESRFFGVLLPSFLLAILCLAIFLLPALAPQAEAAIGTGGALCTAQSKSAGTSLSCSPTLESFNVGNIAVMIFAGNNTATVDGNDGLLSSVTDDKGNTWTVQRCFTNSRGSAGAGATTCIATAKITTELATSAGNNITANFSSITAKSMVVKEFTVDSGNTLEIAGTPQDDARLTDPINLTITGLTSGEYLFLRSVAIERTAPGAWTSTAGFSSTTCNGTSNGLNASNMEVCGEYVIESSSTGTSSNPTASGNDNASIFVALSEVIIPDYSLGGSIYSDAGINKATGTKTVKIVIATTTTSVFSTTSDALGNWSLPITDFSAITTGTKVLVYVDGETNFKASTFTKLADNTTSVTNLDLYHNRAILRDEIDTATTTTLGELTFYDGADDSDIRYIFSGTSSMNVLSGTELYIKAGTTFSPEGTVTVEGNGLANSTDGSLYVGGVYTPSGTTTLAGNLVFASSSTYYTNVEGFVFTATTTGKYVYAPSSTSLGPIVFNGVGGGWLMATAAEVSDFTITNGTVVGPIGTLTISGDFINNGTYIEQGGELVFSGADLTLSGEGNFGNLTLAAAAAADLDLITHADFNVSVVAVDQVNGIVYFGTGIEGSPTEFASIYRCDLTTACDASGDFSEVFTASADRAISALVIDEINARLYLGTGSGEGAIYGCNLSSDCNASGDFVLAYDTTESVISSFLIDDVNQVLYVGTESGGIIYRCLLSTGCDASGDFTTAYDTTETSIESMVIDVERGILFVGTSPSGIIYRCLLSTGCDASGDFTTAYDTAENAIESMVIDTSKDRLYAGGSGDLFVCSLSSLCDVSGDFANPDLSGADLNYQSMVVAPAGVLFIGEVDLVRYVDVATSSLTVLDDISVQNLTIGTYASATLPASMTVGGSYTNNGTVTAAGTTTFSGFTQVATGTLTGTSALGGVTFSGLANFQSGNATSTFTETGVIWDTGSSSDELIGNVVDETTLYTVGFCTGCGSAGGEAILVAAYDKNSGALLWSTTTDPSTGDDRGTGIAVDNTYAYVWGEWFDGADDALYLMALNKSTGDFVWSTSQDPSSGTDIGASIVVDGDYLYANGACATCGAGSSATFYTAQFTKDNGTLLWSTTTDPSSSLDIATGIYTDERYVYTMGYCIGCGDKALAAVYTIALVKETGALVWQKYADPTFLNDLGYRITGDEDTVYVTAYCFGCNSSNKFAYYTIAYDKVNGTERWATTTDPGEDDRARGIAVDDEYVYLSGYCTNCVVVSSTAIYVLVLDKATGAFVQSASTSAAIGESRGEAMAYDGHYLYVSGVCVDCGQYEGEAAYTVKFDKTNLALVTGDSSLTFGANASTSALTIAAISTNIVSASDHLSVAGDFYNENIFSAPSGNFIVGGNFTNYGNFSANDGVVKIDSAYEQIIEIDSTASSTFYDISLSGPGQKTFASIFTTAYDSSETSISSLAIDAANGVLYAGGSGSSIIYRCLLTTGCDASEDFTTAYDTSESSVDSLVIDSTNGVLYAGTGRSFGDGGIIYRCLLSTGCDASGDFAVAYNTTQAYIYSLAIDATNGVLYAGTYSGGIIYRCLLSTGCDASGDFTTAYDTSETYIHSLAIDATNNVLYAGSGNSGIIYRCLLSTGCDASGDFTTAYDTSEASIYSLIVDSVNGTLYVGGGSGIIYRCLLSTECDGSRALTEVYDNALGININNFTIDSLGSTLYAGVSGGNTYRFQNGFDFGTSATTSDLVIAEGHAMVAPIEIEITGDYINEGFFNAGGGTTTFSGTGEQTATGTMTGTSAFANLAITNTAATTTFGSALTVSDTLTAFPGTKIALQSGATTTVANLNLAGSSTSPVTFGATETTSPANFVLTGSSAVTYTTIQNNHACGSTGGVIDVLLGNNTDGGDTECWIIVPSNPQIAMTESQTFFIGQTATPLNVITVYDAINPVITAVDDIRITIATSTTNFLWADTGFTFLNISGTAAGKVDLVPTYTDGFATVVIDVTSDFESEDTLIISGLTATSFSSVSTTTSALALHLDGDSVGSPIATSTETFRITGLLSVVDHDAGQTDNQFSWQNQDDVTLFSFSLEATGETATVTDMVVTLSGLQKIDGTNISDFKLYEDINSDGELDGGDALIESGGILNINGQYGAITFSTDVLATTTTNYIVTGDTTAITNGAAVYFSLPALGVSATGSISGSDITVLSTVTNIQHLRNNSSGGGSSQIGGATPPGATTETGGGSGGGDEVGQETDGDNIAPDADFYAPTGTSTPNQWTNPENVYASDGLAATAATNNYEQTFINFGFNIPGSNVIDGISVKLDASGSTAAGTIDVALSWNGGSSFTSAKATPTLSDSDVVYTVGGGADTWGRSWSAGEFAPSEFILRVTANTSSNTLLLDALEVRVFHRAAGGGGGGGGGII